MGPETTLLMTSLNRQGRWNTVQWNESSYGTYARLHAGSRKKGYYIFLCIPDFRKYYKKKRKYVNNIGWMFIHGPERRHSSAWK